MRRLLHRIIGDLPGTTVVAIIRPKGSLTGTDRMAQLLKKDIFKPFYGEGTEHADAEALSAARIQVIDGDLSDVPELPTDLDIVVHCAGDVSFDPPIDEAFTTNVLGTKSLLERIDARAARRAAFTTCTSPPPTSPDGGAGAIPEASVEHTVDWRTEAEAGMRDEVPDRGAVPVRADAGQVPQGAPRSCTGRAGHLTAAADTERRRTEWVAKKLVETGSERGPQPRLDRLLHVHQGAGRARGRGVRGPKLPTSIVRPSIIESALQSPHPGWIEGFKMAEPLILAYGRGELPEFPAQPGLGGRHHPGRPRRRRDLRGVATEPEPAQAGVLPRQLRRAGTR